MARVLDNFFAKIYINIWPIEMAHRRLLHIVNYLYWLILKPGKLIIGHK
jgi:hypothetical protein